MKARLEGIVAFCDEAEFPMTATSGWEGGEDVRRAELDLDSGRAGVRAARRHAQNGLTALFEGRDASAYLMQAESLLTALRAAGKLDKSRPVYGRPASDRNRLFRAAVDGMRERVGGRVGVVKLGRLVLAEDRQLQREFVNPTDKALRLAYDRGSDS